MSKIRTLSTRIYERVAAIQKANGYNTDIGLKVYRGKRTADQTEVPLAFIIEGDERVLEQQTMRVRVQVPFVIEGHAVCDVNNPNDTVHDIVEDVTRAIFGADPTFGGIVVQRNGDQPGLKYEGRTVGDVEAGASIVGAAVMFSCELLIELNAP